jgi:16S rRNA processing protein RimM
VKSDQAPRTHLCAVGVIAKVFGVKGEVKLHLYSRSLEEFEELGTILVGKSEESVVEMTIERVTARGKDVYIKFQDVSDRNASESLIGHFLFVEETKRKRLESGEFFVDDIIGLTVFDLHKKRLGVLTDVVQYAAQDMYIVKTSGGDVMVPAVRSIVQEVDVKKRTMTIDPPEGLFDGEAV